MLRKKHARGGRFEEVARSLEGKKKKKKKKKNRKERKDYIQDQTLRPLDL